MLNLNAAPAFHRDAELDGLRGLAVAMVLAWHFIGIPAWATSGWLEQKIFRFFLFGGAGVDLFFVLSGFLITRILITRTKSTGDFLRAFYIRRALRILPPYLILLGIFWLIVGKTVPNHVFNGDIPLLRFLTFTQNYWMSQNATYGPDGISVTWSVAIEEQYYLAFPLLALALPPRKLPYYLLAIALISIIWREFIFWTDPGNNFPSDLGTLARLDGLAVGGLVACAFNRVGAASWMNAHRLGLQRAMIVCIVLFSLVRRDSGIQMAYLWHTLLTIGFGLILVNILLNLGSDKFWMRLLRGHQLRFLGKISYSLYLFHPIILASLFLISGYSKNIAGLPQGLVLIVSLVISIIFSELLFELLEKRLIAFGRKITY